VTKEKPSSTVHAQGNITGTKKGREREKVHRKIFNKEPTTLKGAGTGYNENQTKKKGSKRKNEDRTRDYALGLALEKESRNGLATRKKRVLSQGGLPKAVRVFGGLDVTATGSQENGGGGEQAT